MKKIWKKFKHWCCKAGLCNLDKCGCDCHCKPKGRSKAFYPTVEKKNPPTAETTTGGTTVHGKGLSTKSVDGKKRYYKGKGVWENVP